MHSCNRWFSSTHQHLYLPNFFFIEDRKREINVKWYILRSNSFKCNIDVFYLYTTSLDACRGLIRDDQRGFLSAVSFVILVKLPLFLLNFEVWFMISNWLVIRVLLLFWWKWIFLLRLTWSILEKTDNLYRIPLF